MDSPEGMRRAALQYSLSRAPIFAGLPEEDLQRLAGYCKTITVRKGTYLFREGDPVVGFYLVRMGCLNVHRMNAEGTELIIHMLRPGQSFAERAITTPGGYPANARAVENSEVILIPSKEFRKHQKERPDLAWRIIASMSHHLRMLVSTIEGLRFKDVETRLLYWLLQHCPDPASRKPFEIRMQMTQEELASELAARRETVSRSLKKLRGMKLIETAAGSIVILNPARLREHFLAIAQAS